MEITLTVNGKPVKATVDEKEMREAMGEKKGKRTGYEHDFDVLFGYYCNDNQYASVLKPSSFTMFPKDRLEAIYETANYYTDEHVAENNARADALMRKLRRFAAEHGGCLSQKTNDCKQYFYHIWWDHVQKQPTWVGNDRQLCGAVAFASKEDTLEAIKEFYDELNWYFTKYDPMPEGWWED